MIFVDSNLPMYLVGAAHPNKQRSRQLLEQMIAVGERLVTDTAVLQEILHRYVAIDRRDAIQPAFDAILGLVEHVEAITPPDADVAKDIVLGGYALSARDALHVAVMQRLDITTLLSFDRGFDRYPGLDRRG